MNRKFFTLFRIRNQKLKALGFAEYADYLASDLWLSRRQRFAADHPAVCAYCRRQAEVIHHNSYDRLGCEADADLDWLCRDCHDELHQFGGVYPPTQKQVAQLQKFGVDQAVVQRLTMHRAYRLIDDLFNCRTTAAVASAGV